MPDWHMYLKFEIRDEWNSSQLMSPNIDQNKATFYFRGFMGVYRFKFLIDGKEFGTGLEVELKEDKNFSCDFTGGFENQICTGM